MSLRRESTGVITDALLGAVGPAIVVAHQGPAGLGEEGGVDLQQDWVQPYSILVMMICGISCVGAGRRRAIVRLWAYACSLRRLAGERWSPSATGPST